VVFEGVKSAIRVGIFVVVQMNIDTQNYRSVGALAELLKQEFGPLSFALNLGEVTRPGWHCRHAARYVTDLRTMGQVWVEAVEAAVDSGLQVVDFLVNWPCPRECDYDYIIGPTGDVYKCISGAGDTAFRVGYVEDPPVVLQRKCAEFVTWNSTSDRRCAHCAYLPECGGGCRYRAWVEQKDLSAVQCEREFYDTAIPGVLRAYSRTQEAGTLLRVCRDRSNVKRPQGAT
jgi:uncharacterized protein